jgi:hypothetical protein
LLFSCLFSPHLSFRVLPYRSVILDPQHLQKKLWVSEWVSEWAALTVRSL